MANNSFNNLDNNEQNVPVDYMKSAPQVLKNVIYLRTGVGVVFFVIGLIMIFMNFPVSLFLTPLIIGVIGFISSLKIRNEIINGTYKTFTGTVVDYEYTSPLKTKLKAIVFESEGKRYRISYSKRKIQIGAVVTIYAPPSVLLFEFNGYYNINKMYAVDIKYSVNNQ